MKRFVTAAAVLTALVLAQQAQAQITNSAHDFRGDASWTSATASGEICVYCHAPHNNADGTAYKPLWNHAISAGQAYTPYTGLDMQGDPSGGPQGVSAMCLSCHDGVLAVDNYGGNGNTGNEIPSGHAAYFGTDLSNDHPISMEYLPGTGAGQDPELRATTTSVTGLTGVTIADLLAGGTTVECSSCHDVHNQGLAGAGHLLVTSNAQSSLCLTCHIK